MKKTIIGIALGALLLGVAVSKKPKSRKQIVLDWITPRLSQSERENPNTLEPFNRMSESELQFVIDLLVKPIYPVPLPANIQARFDQLSAKYNIFT